MPSYVLILPIIIASLLLYSIATTSVNWIDPSALGLASRLPLTYWVGLGLLASLWYIGRDSKRLLAISFVLLIMYLYAGPTIIRAPVWISNSFYPFGESKLVTQLGHVDYRSGVTLVSYLDWPSFLYFSSQFSLATGIPDYFILKYFPLLLVTLYGLLLILIQRTKLGTSMAIFSGAWLLSGFFIRQQYFGPQAIAFVLFLMGILLISWIFFDDKPHKRTLVGLFLLVFLSTTFMHPLTSLMLVVSLFAVYLTQRIFLKRTSRIALPFCLFSTIAWLSYNALFAAGFFNLMVAQVIDLITGRSSPNIYSETSRVVGSRAMQISNWSSWGIVGLYALVGLISIILISWRGRKKKGNFSKEQEYSLFNVILLIMLGLFAVTGEYGTTEAYQRAFFFGLVPLSYLCVSLLKNKSRLLAAILIMAIFLNIPAQYGSDTYRLAADTQLSGVQFLTSNAPQSFSVIGKFTLFIRYFDPLRDYTVPDIGLDYPFTSLPNSSAVDQAMNQVLSQVDYVMRSGLEDNFYVYSLGFNPLDSINLDERCNRIYDNGQFVLYVPTNST